MRESRRLDSVRPTVQPRFPKPSAVKLNESLTFTKLYRGKAQTGIFQEPQKLVNGAGWETIVTSAAGPGERRGGEGEGRRKGREGGGEGGDVCF